MNGITKEQGIEAARKAREKLLLAYDKAGVTFESVAQSDAEQMKATRRKSSCFMGSWSYSKSEPDWKAREDVKARVSRVFDAFPSERHELNMTGPVRLEYVNDWRQPSGSILGELQAVDSPPGLGIELGKDESKDED